mmetsp:Transcript_14456/g.16167  ORF Transcript_14456/g.16167 Transcript_14456/m.16167 type:complete len:131 (-) Transcript_14456:82-474(-)
MERVMELSLGIQKELEELKEDTDFMDWRYYNFRNRIKRRPKEANQRLFERLVQGKRKEKIAEEKSKKERRAQSITTVLSTKESDSENSNEKSQFMTFHNNTKLSRRQRIRSEGYSTFLNQIKETKDEKEK